MSTPAQQFAAFAAAHRGRVTDELSTDVVGRLLDTVGNCLAAAALTDPSEPHNAIARVLRARGGRPESGVLLGGPALPASSAAMINGTLAHALDFDDTHLPSVLHPSSSVVPAALAVAQVTQASGADLIAAIAVGIEITNRIGMAGYVPALRNSVFFVRGQHATSICGTFGAAVAAAMVLGLDEGQICDAIGIAASMGAGIIEANRTGGSVKRIHCGWAAQAGIDAAAFAAEGVTGPPTVFEGTFGFLQAYLGSDYNLKAMLDGLGERWELLRTVYKPYPSNHFTHPIVDCALALREQGLPVDQIESVDVGVAETVIRTIGEPREEKISPRTPYHAKFSAPYVLASALVGGGGLGIDVGDFTDGALHEPARLALAAKVSVVPDAICDDEFPDAFSAVVTATLASGATMTHRTHSSRGGPEHPLSTGELQTKFTLNAEQRLPAEDGRRIATTIRGLPDASVVPDLLDGAWGITG